MWLSDADLILCIQPCPHTTGSALIVSQRTLWRALGHWQTNSSQSSRGQGCCERLLPIHSSASGSDQMFTFCCTSDKVSRWVQLFELVKPYWLLLPEADKTAGAAASAGPTALPAASSGDQQLGGLGPGERAPPCGFALLGDITPFQLLLWGNKDGQYGNFCTSVSAST